MHRLKQDEHFSTQSGLEARLMYWMTEHSLTLLRISLGLVFFIFGALKFLPNTSPAESLSVRTLERLSLGLMEGDIARLVVAIVEVVVGVSLLTGWLLKAGVILLGFVMLAIMAPLVLFAGELFPGPRHTPTLEAQYVFKDVVLAAASIVVALRARGAKMVVDDTPGAAHKRREART